VSKYIFNKQKIILIQGNARLIRSLATLRLVHLLPCNLQVLQGRLLNILSRRSGDLITTVVALLHKGTVSIEVYKHPGETNNFN